MASAGRAKRCRQRVWEMKVRRGRMRVGRGAGEGVALCKTAFSEGWICQWLLMRMGGWGYGVREKGNVRRGVRRSPRG